MLLQARRGYLTGRSAYDPAAGGGGFTPASLSGLFVWLDASDTATITESGGNVTAWNDKSGVGNHFTAVNNPVYSATSFPGSLPGITTTAASSQHFLRNSVALNTPTLSIFAVLRITSNPSGNSGIFCFTNGSGNDFNSNGGLAFTSNAGPNGIRGVKQSYDASVTVPIVGNAGVGGLVLDSGNGTTYGNFSTTATDTYTSVNLGNTTANIVIGARMAPTVTTNYLNAVLAEIVATTTALDGTDRANLQSYFTAKWGTP